MFCAQAPAHFDFAWYDDLWYCLAVNVIATGYASESVASLLAVGSLINHSCRPNAVHTSDAGDPPPPTGRHGVHGEGCGTPCVVFCFRGRGGGCIGRGGAPPPPAYGGAGRWDRREFVTWAPSSATRQGEEQHRHIERGSHTKRDKGGHTRQGGGAQQGRRGYQNGGNREPEWSG